MENDVWGKVFALLDLVKNPSSYEKVLNEMKVKEEAALGGIRAKRDAAQKFLDDARHERQNAEEDSDHIIATAKAKADEILSAADKRRLEFEAYKENELAKISVLRDQLKRELNDLSDRQTVLRNSESKAASMKATAEALQTKLDKRLSALKAAGITVE